MSLELVRALLPAVLEAGARIEALRAAGVPARSKADGSLVTDADEAAEALLVDAIGRLSRGVPVAAEEAWGRGARPALGDCFWLVDALDGTRDFVAGGRDYTVNVGLVAGGAPVLGLVLAPATGTLWAGAAGEGAFRRAADGRLAAIATRPLCAAPVLAVSRARRDGRTDAFMAQMPGATEIAVGSSLKFCLLAEGAADFHLRFSPTREWDTAAGHAVLAAAGGAVRAAGGGPLLYGKPELANGGFLAAGDPAALARLPEALGFASGAAVGA